MKKQKWKVRFGHVYRSANLKIDLEDIFGDQNSNPPLGFLVEKYSTRGGGYYFGTRGIWANYPPSPFSLESSQSNPTSVEFLHNSHMRGYFSIIFSCISNSNIKKFFSGASPPTPQGQTPHLHLTKEFLCANTYGFLEWCQIIWKLLASKPAAGAAWFLNFKISDL